MLSTAMLTPAHGYPILALVGSWVVHHAYMPTLLMKGRKQFGVKYPDLYATEANCPNKENRTKFNCMQRAHQNSLENQPIFLALLLASMQRFPVTSAAAAAAYLIGRVLYFHGYSTGVPDARHRGALLQYPGLLVLLGCSVRLAVELFMGAKA